jgi:hypothetical protein
MERSPLKDLKFGRELNTLEARLRTYTAKGLSNKNLLIKALYETDGELPLYFRVLREAAHTAKLLPFEKGRLIRLIHQLETTRGKALLKEDALVKGLVLISLNLPKAIRRVDTWQPKSHNPQRLFGELLRHLFTRYPVPTFLDSAFLETDPLYADWFIHLGQGGSVRHLPQCPINMTAKMMHWFMQTPPQYSVPEALRYAQIKTMGGCERLVKTVLGSKLGQSFDHDDFWETVIRFFVQNPMMALKHVQPIVDYIHHVKYTEQIAYGADYNSVTMPPEQPHFTMKGRTVLALLRVVEDWHRTMGAYWKKGKEMEPKTWQPASFKNFQYEEGGAHDTRKIYYIRQVTSSLELRYESRVMKHCVYSYTSDCLSGRTSIWTLLLADTDGFPDKLLTIEVSNPTKSIMQIRGKLNRMPTIVEMKIIDQWASVEGLAVYKWARY